MSPVEFEAFYPVAFFPVKRQTTSRSAAVIILARLAEHAQQSLPLAMRFEDWDQNKKPLREGGFRSAIADANKMLREYYQRNRVAIAERLALKEGAAEELQICLQRRTTGRGDVYQLRWACADRKRAPRAPETNLLEDFPGVTEALRVQGIEAPESGARSQTLLVGRPREVSELAAILGLLADNFPAKTIPFPGFQLIWWWCYPPRTWTVCSRSGDVLAVTSIWAVPSSCAEEMLGGHVNLRDLVGSALDQEESGPFQHMYIGAVAFAPDEDVASCPALLHLLLHAGLKSAIDENRVAFPLTVITHPIFPSSVEALKLCGFVELGPSGGGLGTYSSQILSQAEAELWPGGWRY